MKGNQRVQVLMKSHPEWQKFIELLSNRLKSNPCNAMDLQQTNWVIETHFPLVNAAATDAYFESEGGFCDCEVLMNVDVP